MHPPIERRGALLAATAGLNAHGVRHSLDGIAQADFILDEESWQTNAMGLKFSFLCVILGWSLPVHDAFRPLCGDAITW
jgi:hypothetical protein